MTVITLLEIQQDVEGYLRRVAAGESFLVIEDELPLAEITPSTTVETRQQRPFGLAKGLITISDDFDAPLPADIVSQFES